MIGVIRALVWWTLVKTAAVSVCDSPVLVLTASMAGLHDAVTKTVGLKQTVPLLTVYDNGTVCGTGWIMLTKDDPEFIFMQGQKQHLSQVRGLLSEADEISVVYECHLSVNFYCSVIHSLNATDVLFYNVGREKQVVSPFDSVEGDGITALVNLVRALATGYGVFDLTTHSVAIRSRWQSLCYLIMDRATEERATLSFSSISGGVVCEAAVSSPVRLWITIAGSDVQLNASSVFDNTNNISSVGAFSSVSPNNSPRCEIICSAGWNVTIRQPNSSTIATERRVALSAAPGELSPSPRTVLSVSNSSELDDLPIYTNRSIVVSYAEEATSHVGRKRSCSLLYLLAVPAVLLVVLSSVVIFRHKIRLLLMDRTVTRFRKRTQSTSRSELSFR
ncbi:m151 [Muromegalovirus G4]|uniref:M151 n=1 Tax=Muromegalovirus G4 TaxID=524650 RepID=B3UX97_MUHV1|nr:m151 [Muromegalovirus G4]QNL29296.1 m151 [Muromegalovirus G4]